MKTQKKILSLAISALLTVGLFAVSATSDAARQSATTAVGSDSDKRSANDSGVEAHQKVTICHVPPGNPANAHTIHISSTAWPAHDRNHPGDYLGSCDREVSKTKESISPETGKRTQTAVTVAPRTIVAEKTHVITGCAATQSTALRNAVRDYYEPAIVPDTALDDPTVASVVANCLDNGDSSDSGEGRNRADSSHARDADGRKIGGKGQAHDSVSDSVSDSGNRRRTTHYIRACQNKSASTSTSNDSEHAGHRADSHSVPLNLKYRNDLKDAVSTYMNTPDGDVRMSKVATVKTRVDAKVAAEGRRGTHVSDSAMDDSGVKTALKNCAKKTAEPNKIDSGKIGKRKGDSGHKYHIVKSCGVTLDTALQNAITNYEAQTSSKPIVITDSALTDTGIKALYDACLTESAGGKDTVTPIVGNVSVSNATISGATITDRGMTGSTVTTGGISVGTQVTPIPRGQLVSTNVIITGAVGNQVIINGTSTGGSVATSYTTGSGNGNGVNGNNQTVTATTTEGTIIGGTPTGGSIADGVITAGSSPSGNVIDARIVDGTFSGGTVTGGNYVGGIVTGGVATATPGATVVTTGGIITGGTISLTGATTNGTGANAVTTGATVINGVITGGTTTGLTITGGTVTGLTQTGATITGAGVSGASIIPPAGISGQLNWRELSQ